MDPATEVRRVGVNGTHLAYIEQGSGPPVIFLHGGFSDLRSWSSQVAACSARFRAIAYSFRYHHPNHWQGNGNDYSIPVHARDLAGLAETLGAFPAHFVGTSYGGRIALHLARDRPDLVRSLVLAEPAIGSWLQGIPGGPAVLADVVQNYFEPGEKAIREGDFERAARRFVDGVGGDGTFERVPEEVRRRYIDNIRVQGIPPSPAPFSREDATKIGVPVLLIAGERTHNLFRLVIEELEKCLPRVERVTIPGTNHLMTVFQGEEFNRAFLPFLARH